MRCADFPMRRLGQPESRVEAGVSVSARGSRQPRQAGPISARRQHDQPNSSPLLAVSVVVIFPLVPNRADRDGLVVDDLEQGNVARMSKGDDQLA